MKYITSCPQCDTHFLINDELITAYGGKVQCGSCEHVFNASDRLTEVGDDITSADEYQATIENTPTEKTPASEIKTDPAPQTNKTLGEETAPNYVIDQPSQTNTPIEVEETPEVTLNLDAVKRKKKKPRQHSFFLSLLCLLLMLAFILQAVYFLRNEIATNYPSLKPTLERACLKLKCKIDLPQHLDLISIGDSDMQEDDAYQSVINFSSSLQNNAEYAQAYPSIELTLTDSDDIPVIKKLIKPTDYLTSKKKIKQGLAPHEVANLKIALHVDEPTVASYRILLLY